MSFISDFINGFKEYTTQIWKNRPSTETPMSAERLNHIEAGIKSISDAIKSMASAIMSDLADLTIGASNWDAEEGTPGYVQNRTHWKEVIQEQAVILEETSVSFSSNMTSLYGIGTDNVTEGMKCIVHWNGTAYECTAFLASQSVFLGNAALASSGDDTGEPFCMEMLSATSAFVMKSTKDAEAITIKVETPGVIKVHKLDKIYMPDDYEGGGGVSSWNDLTDKPFGEEGSVIEIFPKRMAVDAGYATESDEFIFFPDENMFNYIGGLPIEAGNEYTIIINGMEFNCVAVDCTAFGGSWALGNVYGVTDGMIGSPTNDPFVILGGEEDGQEMVMGMLMSPVASLTLTILFSGVTVKKIDRKFIPQLNSSHLPDSVPSVEVVENILPETTIEISSTEKYQIFDIPDLVVGAKYTVVWNGEEYSCEAMACNSDYATVGIGKFSIMGLHGYEAPFGIVQMTEEFEKENGYSALILSNGDTGTITLSIPKAEIHHKIHEDCMPYKPQVFVVKAEYAGVNSENKESYRPNVTYAETLEAAAEGRLVMVCIVTSSDKVECYYFTSSLSSVLAFSRLEAFGEYGAVDILTWTSGHENLIRSINYTIRK